MPISGLFRVGFVLRMLFQRTTVVLILPRLPGLPFTVSTWQILHDTPGWLISRECRESPVYSCTGSVLPCLCVAVDYSLALERRGPCKLVSFMPTLECRRLAAGAAGAEPFLCCACHFLHPALAPWHLAVAVTAVGWSGSCLPHSHSHTRSWVTCQLWGARTSPLRETNRNKHFQTWIAKELEGMSRVKNKTKQKQLPVLG